MLKWIIPIVLILIIIIRNKKRGYFWKARNGEHLTLKQFFKRWLKGVEGVTPLQQTKTTLLSFPLIIGGITTGMIITLINKTYWMTLILSGSLPITTMQIVSTWQKYKQQKRIYDTMKEIENQTKLKRKKNAK